MLDFIPSPTGEAFQLSDKFIKLICGPVGGGKSTVALYDLWLRAFRQKPFKGVRRTRFIILRNTMGQLKSTVKPLIDQWLVAAFDGKAGSWRLSENTFELRIALSDGTTIRSEFVMMAADTPDDVRRLLSLECSAAWVEECREVDQTVFEGLIGRVNRFPNRQSGGVTYPGLICSTNPPPMDTFWHKLMTDPPGNTGIFMQPPAVMEDGGFNLEAENLNNLNPGYYENLLDGKAKGWVDVYLRNKFGAGGFGEPVFKGVFNRDFHVTKEPLKPVYSGAHKIIVGSDNGLTASAVIGQRDALGKVNVLDVAFVPDGETMGYERFLETLLLPKLRLLGVPNKDVLFMVDPACFTRAEATEVTIAMVIQRHGFAVQRAGSNSPEVRIRACEELLVKQIDGGPLLRVSPTAAHLVSTLDWGFRYRKATASGGEPTVDKNHFSHTGDAFEYFCMHFASGKTADNWQSKKREIQNKAYCYA